MIPGQKNRTIVVGMNDFFVGGGQRLVADILKQPFFECDNVHLVTFMHDERREVLLSELPKHIVHHRINFSHLMDIGGWWRLYRLLLKIQPEIVWTHFFFSNTVFRTLRLFFRYRVIAVEHNTYVWKTWFHRVIDRILSFFTYKIVAVSQTVANFTSKQEHIPIGKFIVIPNGVDLKRLAAETEELSKDEIKQSLGLGRERSYIINVGRLSTQKNHQLLIEAFDIFAKKNFNYDLLIIGEGPERVVLEKMVREKELANRVRFLGARMDVSRWYVASDFFVLTSKIEGFALVCIEAMSFGLPVISTKVAGPDVYIVNDQNGYLATADPADIAGKMLLLATLDQEALSAMRASAKKTAEEYDIKKTAHAYSDLFSASDEG